MTELSQSRYSTVAMLFHWIIAILVIWNWRIAENAEHAASREEAIAIFADHKALGIIILALSVGRLVWRLGHKAPPMSSLIPQWQQKAAKALHIIFYILLIGLPIGGWLANSLSGREIDMFGMFTIPALPVGENPDAGKAIYEAHATGGSIMIYLIALHILAALKHTFIDKVNGIGRMLPFGRT